MDTARTLEAANSDKDRVPMHDIGTGSHKCLILLAFLPQPVGLGCERLRTCQAARVGRGQQRRAQQMNAWHLAHFT